MRAGFSTENYPQGLKPVPFMDRIFPQPCLAAEVRLLFNPKFALKG
jgi:hypothetical protein